MDLSADVIATKEVWRIARADEMDGSFAERRQRDFNPITLVQVADQSTWGVWRRLAAALMSYAKNNLSANDDNRT